MNKISQLYAERSLPEAVARGKYANQRQSSRAIGLRLGKTHYLLKLLVDRRLINVSSFNESKNKMGYVYLLAPSGEKEKNLITKQFLAAKEREYVMLEQGIEALKGEIKLEESGGGRESWYTALSRFIEAPWMKENQ